MEEQNVGRDTGSTLTQRSFRDVVSKHLDRLAGTRNDHHTMPLDVAGIASVVLLVEREALLDDSSADSTQRFSEESLLEELSELVPGEDAALAATVRWLQENDYVDSTAHGELRPTEASSMMSKFLDQVFPTMPGMGLVAILVQTAEEVNEGRKDLDLAIDQIDLTLQSHGVPLSHSSEGRVGEASELPDGSKAGSVRPVKQGGAKNSGDQVRERLRSYALQEQARKNEARIRTDPLPNQDIVASTDRTDSFASRDLAAEPWAASDTATEQGSDTPTASPEALEASGDPTSAEREMSEDMSATAAETQGSLAPASGTAPWPEQDALDSERHAEPPDLDEEVGSEPLTAGTDEPPAASDNPSPDERPDEEASQSKEGKEDETIDEAVESQIAEFEETLAMPCPICGTGKIHEKTTSKGKLFYQCSNKDCMLIHWGRPYHIPCPLCSNPFLVEVTNRTGKVVLKCPRAACRHQQRLPGAEDVPTRTRPTPAVKKAQGTQGRTQRQGKRKVRKVLVRKRKAG